MSGVPKNQEKLAVYGAVAGLLGYLWWMSQNHMPNVTVASVTLPDNRYDPFIHWRTEHPGDWTVPHPAAVGANCLPRILQTAPIGRVMAEMEMTSGSYSQ